MECKILQYMIAAADLRRFVKSAREILSLYTLAPAKFKNLRFKNLTSCTAAVQSIIKFTKFATRKRREILST